MAAAANTQAETLKDLAEKTSKDSRSMKVVTFISMLYLPATLIAVSITVCSISFGLQPLTLLTLLKAIFSTSLIQLPNVALELPEKSTKRTVSIQRAMWIYALSSAVLTAITLACAMVWDQRPSRFRRVDSRGRTA